jgi:formamidopyrimidine-DNA glycosylase
MPELPEVETTCRGLSPLLHQKTIQTIHVYQPKLRQPVPENLANLCHNQTIQAINRRGKYIILHLKDGAILIHLGMTGHLRVLPEQQIRQKHDHIDVVFTNKQVLRYHDPRRFGCWQWVDGPLHQHPSLSHLGIEPLDDGFDGQYLMNACLHKKQPIKSTIMDCRFVVGVGNIYATESLYLSRIHPLAPAGSLSNIQYEVLAEKIKEVLNKAIEAGGTTLKDFINPEGKPGYFAQSLFVYGRNHKPCPTCGDIIKSIKINGRSTAFCPTCQSA